MDRYAANVRCKQLLRSSLNHITRPRLVAAYKLWFGEWEDELRSQREKEFGTLLREQREARLAAEEELQRVRVEVGLSRDEAVSLKEQKVRLLALASRPSASIVVSLAC